MTVPRREQCDCTQACRCESQLLALPNVPHAFPLSLTLTGRRGARTKTRALCRRACLRLRCAAVQGAERQSVVNYCGFVEYFRSAKRASKTKTPRLTMTHRQWVRDVPLNNTWLKHRQRYNNQVLVLVPWFSAQIPSSRSHLQRIYSIYFIMWMCPQFWLGLCLQLTGVINV